MSLHRNRSLMEKGWARALLFLLCYLLLTIIVAFVLANYQLQKHPEAAKYSSLIWIGATCIISFLLVYLFRKYADKRTFLSIGFDRENRVREILLGLAAGLFLLSIGSLLIFLLNGLRWIDMQDQKDLLIIILLLMVVAFSEEIVFRGYILRNLMKSMRSWMALLLSALIFMLVHVSNTGASPVGLVNIFLGGILLGIMYISTGNLWTPMAFHFAWNFLQGPVFGFPVSGLSFGSMLVTELDGSQWITGGEFGFEGSIVCTILLLPVCIITCWQLFRNRQLPVIKPGPDQILL